MDEGRLIKVFLQKHQPNREIKTASWVVGPELRAVAVRRLVGHRAMATTPPTVPKS